MNCKTDKYTSENCLHCNCVTAPTTALLLVVTQCSGNAVVKITCILTFGSYDNKYLIIFECMQIFTYSITKRNKKIIKYLKNSPFVVGNSVDAQ